MTINDGYGDEPLIWERPFDFDEFRKLLHLLANDMRPYGDPLHDDLVQEGAIAMWRAHKTFDPKKGNYFTHMRMVAKKRMLDIASLRKSMMRDESLGNRNHAEPRGERLFSYEFAVDQAEDDQTPVEALLLDPTQPDVFDHVQSGYHRGEVMAALRELDEPVREYVVLRFWGGLEPRGARPTSRHRGSTQYLAWQEHDETQAALAKPMDHRQWLVAQQHLAKLLAEIEL